jgi:hypothetical protein
MPERKIFSRSSLDGPGSAMLRTTMERRLNKKSEVSVMVESSLSEMSVAYKYPI